MSWDPILYLRYGDERLRPALDLLARIPTESPGAVVDLGCGAGNVTAILKARWPGADVLGIDNAEPMLERARQVAPTCRFEAASFADWSPAVAPAVIYSNAALQWLGGHDTLFPRLISLLAPGGVLAVQMPSMHDAPLRRLQYEVAATGPWAGRLAGITSARSILAPQEYWSLLRPRCATLEMWETTYLHALQGEDAVAQWASGTSLRPFLDALDEPVRSEFAAAYAEALRPHYPRQDDGTTLLPFRRLFILASRMTGPAEPPTGTHD
jgi:trans-aconitate 2-methyltransferase